MKVDVLVIGHGIAGCVLSYLLKEAGATVMVIDTPAKNESSRVAAGLYNPITGRKMVKTWQADVLFPLLKKVYRQLERASNSSFLHEREIYRPFIDIAEQNDWQGRSAENGWQGYIKEVLVNPLYPESLKNNFGGLLIKNAGWLDVNTMLNSWQQRLVADGNMREDIFNEGGLEVTAGGITYGDVQANAIVYANGRMAANSNYWGYLPFSPVKGEIIQITSKANLPVIPNRGVFMAPLSQAQTKENATSDTVYRVGSTYNHKSLNQDITVEAKTELENRLQEVFLAPYKLIGQVAGVRPATKDRRPFVGQHPNHKKVYILNGLGTKGVSLAPFCARALVDNLLKNTKIPAEINIERYISLY